MAPFCFRFPSFLLAASLAWPAVAADPDWTGLWEGIRVFGPRIDGPVVLVERAAGLTAETSGYSAAVRVHGDRYTFEIPGGRGSFRGRRDGNQIRGIWTQEVTQSNTTAYATPLALRREGSSWRGTITPLKDRFSYYLPVTRAPDGSFSTYLRNPERNDGVFTQVQRLAIDGDKVALMGNRRGRKDQVPLYEGRVSDGVMTLPMRAGTYDFRRIDEAASAFYPRGRTPARYSYEKPLQRDDGWATALPEDVGLSRESLEALVQSIVDTKMESVGSSQIHSVLIARHGKLVLEEYFHGHHRDQPHETRSAAKSLASVVVGAAMQSGMRIGPGTPVYATMLGAVPEGADPRKRSMTLEHLLMMRGGHFCNDSNPDAPGNEDAMQEQEKERDWYRFILALPMDRTPGEKTIYCSIDAHLAGGVTAKIAGEPWIELFDRLVARPLQFDTYHWFLAPTGEAYTGGGALLLPRDFLKVAQLMLDDGVWRGKRILSKEWARKSTAALHDLTPRQQYGYLWNSVEYPYRGKSVRAFFAAGNGGQIFMGIPDLGLAIAFTGGNYADAALFIPQRSIVPERILPAVVR